MIEVIAMGIGIIVGFAIYQAVAMILDWWMAR